MFETSDTELLEALCDVNTEGKMKSDRNSRNGSEKKLPIDPEQRN